MISKSRVPNQLANEKIVKHLRRHWFIFFQLFLFFVALFVLPIVLWYFFQQNFPALLNSPLAFALIVVVMLIYYLMMLVFAFTAWTENYLDIWTITNERIISREQIALFNRTISEVYLDRVQDVAAEQKGFFPTIFHYGDVYIQSAAEKERFVFSQVPEPYHTAKLIQQLADAAKANNHVNV